MLCKKRQSVQSWQPWSQGIKKIKYESIVARDLTLTTGRQKNPVSLNWICNFPRSLINNSCRHRNTHCMDSHFSFIEEIKTSVRESKLFCHKCLEVFKFQIVARVFHSSLARVGTRTIMKNLPNSFFYMYIGGELKRWCLCIYVNSSIRKFNSGETNSVCRWLLGDFLCWPSTYFLDAITARTIF